MQDAINKLQAEMAAAAGDAYIQQVGGELLHIIAVNPGAAEKIMTPDKTIKGSYEAMEALAKKKAVNRAAVFTPDEGRAVILNYFGIKADTVPAPAAVVPVPADAVPPAPVTQSPGLSLELDDLFGDL
jgi:hypothetical protein